LKKAGQFYKEALKAGQEGLIVRTLRQNISREEGLLAVG